ncbi:MAG: hypothetical protein OXF74_13435 [Rhodobacteraceae bacterium]|nr:hypothetical protein [Paracoccaceae bacterium]
MTPRVALGNDFHMPSATTPGGQNLITLYQRGLAALQTVEHPCECGMAYFLFTVLHQFCFDGNKRTGRFMMNGVMMMHGWDAISVPASRAHAFNEKMVGFYTGRDGTEMMTFLYDCCPQDTPTPVNEPDHQPDVDDSPSPGF